MCVSVASPNCWFEQKLTVGGNSLANLWDMAFRYPLTCFNFYLFCFLRRDPGSVGISTETPIQYAHCLLLSFLSSLLAFSFSAFFLPAFLPSSLPPSNIMFPVYYAPGTGDPSLRSSSVTEESPVQGLSLQTESQMGHRSNQLCSKQDAFDIVFLACRTWPVLPSAHSLMDFPTWNGLSSFLCQQKPTRQGPAEGLMAHIPPACCAQSMYLFVNCVFFGGKPLALISCIAN